VGWGAGWIFVNGVYAVSKDGASPPGMASIQLIIVRFEYIKPYIKVLLELQLIG